MFLKIFPVANDKFFSLPKVFSHILHQTEPDPWKNVLQECRIVAWETADCLCQIDVSHVSTATFWMNVSSRVPPQILKLRGFSLRSICEPHILNELFFMCPVPNTKFILVRITFYLHFRSYLDCFSNWSGIELFRHCSITAKHACCDSEKYSSTPDSHFY